MQIGSWRVHLADVDVEWFNYVEQKDRKVLLSTLCIYFSGRPRP